MNIACNPLLIYSYEHMRDFRGEYCVVFRVDDPERDVFTTDRFPSRLAAKQAAEKWIEAQLSRK